MVIQNSEVSMASKGSYSTATKVDTQVNTTPAIKIGEITFNTEGDFMSSLNYSMGKNGEVEEVGDGQKGESMPANRMARLQAMSYLIKALLLSKIFGEDKSFNEIIQEMFGENSGMLQTTTVNYEYTETQEVSFMAKGTAVTADGRNLQFDYGFTMSESFKEEFKSVESAFLRYIDPLVVNLKDSPSKMSNQMFYFDLDGDGQKEQISQLSKGSGYLALDKNEDGIINDGLELFGPATGDGFKELMGYDSDGNGWIDENDPIFEKLRVWTVNEAGENELYSLKESDVGAIYLGRVRTDFIDYDKAHNARAAIRESGIFLHESDGHAGSVQHVDLRQ